MTAFLYQSPLRAVQYHSCVQRRIFVTASRGDLHLPGHCFHSVFSHPHMHDGDIVEKRADSGGFKPHLLGNETTDGVQEEAERQK